MRLSPSRTGPGAGSLANRNFTWLWVRDVVSEFGSQATAVTMRRLVLAKLHLRPACEATELRCHVLDASALGW